MVQRIRLRYAKRGPLRFASHRDFARMFERALRRAGVPMAFSAGFSPHPKVSYVGAAPTGAASEAEYVEIGLASPVDPEALREALDRVLPDGFAVLDAVEAVTPDFARRVDASRWSIVVPDVEDAVLRRAAQTFLDAPAAPVTRRTKSGLKEVDVRAAVLTLTVDAHDPVTSGRDTGDARRCTGPSGRCGILVAVVRQTTPVVRPDDVLAALRAMAGLPDTGAVIATRLEHGGLDAHGALVDPLAADRAVAGTSPADSPAI